MSLEMLRWHRFAVCILLVLAFSLQSFNTFNTVDEISDHEVGEKDLPEASYQNIESKESLINEQDRHEDSRKSKV